MTKSSLYTKKGDKGSTGLVGGTRISKADSRIDLYGDVDELNSCIGVCISHMKDSKKYDAQTVYLKVIQSRLFDLGSNFACEKEKRDEFKLPKIESSQLKDMESAIDLLDNQLEKLRYFVLPGGHPISSFLHVARTVCRRVERKAVSFEMDYTGELPQESLKYLNRLSDYLFVLSRYVNFCEEEEETFWIPNNK